MYVVWIGMTDDEIIRLVWNMLILKKRFENDPYSLSFDEIETLREYDEYQDQKFSWYLQITSTYAPKRSLIL